MKRNALSVADRAKLQARQDAADELATTPCRIKLFAELRHHDVIHQPGEVLDVTAADAIAYVHAARPVGPLPKWWPRSVPILSR